MKFPPYIKDCDRELTRNLYLQVRNKQGIKQASIFKKITLTAAYGEMYKRTIDYTTFLRDIERHIKRNCLVDTFWNIIQDVERNGILDELFYIKEKSIISSKPKDLEKEIIITLKKYYPQEIKIDKLEYCKQIIENNITTNEK